MCVCACACACKMPHSEEPRVCLCEPLESLCAFEIEIDRLNWTYYCVPTALCLTTFLPADPWIGLFTDHRLSLNEGDL